MKKVLVAAFLGLLLAACAPYLFDENTIMIDPLKNSTYEEVKALANSACSSRGHGQAINVEKPHRAYDRYQISFECSGAEAAIAKEKKEKLEKLEKYKKEEEKKEQVKITSMVDDAKSACKNIGHEEGTDRFEDCSLDLYKQSVALAAEKNQQIIYTGSSSLGSSSVTIYDPVRDANRAMDRGMKILTGQCGVSGLEC